LKPRIFCDSVHRAITEIVQHLLVTGNPTAELVSNSSDGPSDAAQAVFDRVREILTQAHFLDGDVPLSETAAGLRRIRIPNPYQISLHLPVRIRITQGTEAAAALLQAFLILRVRYQSVVGTPPSVRIEASAADEAALDT